MTEKQQPSVAALGPYGTIGAKLIRLQKGQKRPVGVPVLGPDRKPIMRKKRGGGDKMKLQWDYVDFEGAQKWMREGGNVGWVIGREYLVLDFDPKNYAPGTNTEQRFLEATGLKDWSKFTQIATPSGGKHIVMRVPSDIMLMATDNEKFPGADFKRGVSYVATAGSVHPNGGVYRWSGDVPVASTAQAPQSVLDLLKIAPPPIEMRRGSGDDDWGIFDEEQLEDMLSHIDVEQFNHKNEEWFKFAMSCHWLTAGEGREVFLDWCGGDDEYSDEAMRDLNGQRWDSFGKEGKHGGWSERRVRGGLVYKYLSAAGIPSGQWPQRKGDRDFVDVTEEENREFIEKIDAKVSAIGARTLSALEEMNRDHAMVLMSGMPLYLSVDYDEAGRKKNFFINETALIQRYKHKVVTVMKGGRGNAVAEEEELGKWWISHPQKRSFDGMEFRLQKPQEFYRGDRKILNTFQGWAFEPTPSPDGFASGWPMFHRVLWEGICNEDKELYEYLLDWMAWSYQRDCGPASVAVMMTGGQGTGKSTLTEVWSAPFGAAAASGDSIEMMLSGENVSYLAEIGALVLNESMWAGNRKTYATLKSRITDNFRGAEKFQPARQVVNNLCIMMSTNDGWAMHVEKDDRRFLIVEPNGKFANNEGFWTAVRKEMFEGPNLKTPSKGCQYFFGDLMKRDIGTFHPAFRRPKTDAWKRQALKTLGEFGAWLLDEIEKGKFPMQVETEDALIVPFDVMHELYIARAGKHNNSKDSFKTAIEATTLAKRERWEVPEHLLEDWLNVDIDSQRRATVLRFPPWRELPRIAEKMWGVKIDVDFDGEDLI